MKRWVIRILCFVLLLAGALWYTNRTLSLKYGDGIYSLTKFYQLEEDTVDVLVLGSSHAFENINTGNLWDEYGMASFVLAASEQPAWNTYYYLKEALKTQKPKLIVLETYMLWRPGEYADDSRIIKNTFGMKWSGDRIEAIKASAPPDRWAEFFLPFIQYHSRYGELSREDFFRDLGDVYYKDWKGFGNNMQTLKCGKPDVSFVTERISLPEKSEQYLRRLLELANEQTIPVLLIAAPYAEISEREQACYNTMGDIAAEYGAGFINYNLKYDEIGLDFEADMADTGHLNYKGNVKFTSALGKDILENFTIPDRRGNEKYASWERNARYISAQTANQELKEMSDQNEKFLRLADPDYVLLISAECPESKAAEMLACLWDTLKVSQPVSSGLWYIDVGNGILHAPEDNEDSCYIALDPHDVLLKKIRQEDGGTCSNALIIDGEDYTAETGGVQVVVYSKTTQEIVDSFNAGVSEEPNTGEWYFDGGRWKVLLADGTFLRNAWYQSPESDLWYYMGDDGYMLTDTITPDGYYVDADGVWEH